MLLILKCAIIFTLDTIFFNCIQFNFTGDRLIVLFPHLTKTVHFISGKYAYHNGYVDFFTNLTKRFRIKKCSMQFIHGHPEVDSLYYGSPVFSCTKSYHDKCVYKL